MDAARGVEDIDMACAVTSTGLSTEEQLTSTEGRRSSFHSTTSLDSLEISKTGVSDVAKEGGGGAEHLVGVADIAADDLKEEEPGGGNLHNEQFNYKELDTSVNVKIADLGNACWVVSFFFFFFFLFFSPTVLTRITLCSIAISLMIYRHGSTGVQRF